LTCNKRSQVDYFAKKVPVFGFELKTGWNQAAISHHSFESQPKIDHAPEQNAHPTGKAPRPRRMRLNETPVP
jgi:hypothetical protein